MAQSKNLKEAKMDQLRFVLAGRTGSGKSTTGNTILGRKAFKACMSASSVTSECQREEVIINGRSYVIVDTPGLFDTRISRVELSKEVTRCVSMSSPGPHIFLLIVNVGRFTKEEIDCFTEMFELFGENLNRYSLIVFTGKDHLQLERKSIENFISGCNELKNIITKCNNNYIAINNKAEDDQLKFEVDILLYKIHSVIGSNQNQHYTNEMFKEAELAFQRKVKKVKEEAEKQKKAEHDIIRAEMQKQVQACQEENKKMLQKIQALENDKYRMQQSAIHDEKQIQLITTAIATMNESMKSINQEHASRMDGLQNHCDKMIDKIEENHQAQINSIRDGTNTDPMWLKEMLDYMEKSEQKHRNKMEELRDMSETQSREIQETIERIAKKDNSSCLIL